ncbi:MAG: hypothetical protein IJT90_04835 [Bacteroidaceae bacterium]|nr:hypothetical protein [Bacteroidaceae bacterium]
MKTPEEFNDVLIREALKRRNAELQHKLSADFADRVMARIEAEKVVPFFRRRPVWLTMAAAAAIVAIVFGLLFATSPLDKPTIAKAPSATAVGDTTTQVIKETPRHLIAETKPEKPVVAKRKAKVAKVAEATETANAESDYKHMEEVQKYSELAIDEAEKAIAMLCTNLDKGLAYMENAGNNIQRVNNSIEEFSNKLINI